MQKRLLHSKRKKLDGIHSKAKVKSTKLIQIQETRLTVPLEIILDGMLPRSSNRFVSQRGLSKLKLCWCWWPHQMSSNTTRFSPSYEPWTESWLSECSWSRGTKPASSNSKFPVPLPKCFTHPIELNERFDPVYSHQIVIEAELVDWGFVCEFIECLDWIQPKYLKKKQENCSFDWPVVSPEMGSRQILSSLKGSEFF